MGPAGPKEFPESQAHDCICTEEGRSCVDSRFQNFSGRVQEHAFLSGMDKLLWLLTISKPSS